MRAAEKLSALPVFGKTLIVAIGVATLGGCAHVDRTATQATVVADKYEDRHPIVVANAPISLDLYAAGTSMDADDQGRVREFIETYRAQGRGPITIMLPAGHNGLHDRYVSTIRSMIARAGVATTLRVGNVPVADQSVATPIRLSFVGLRARVATRCGEWPDDLASGSNLHTWQNRQYWNMGCAYQNMIAQQTADPRDLAGPRGETPSDTRMRIRAIGKVRQGNDPGTSWRVQGSNIGAVGGN